MSFDQTLDRREAIIERLLAIGQGASGIAAAHRDFGPTPTGILGVPRPAFLLYSGSTKIAQPTEALLRHKSTRMPTTLWVMSPQIVILEANRDTVENVMLDGVADPVGPRLSSWSMMFNDLIVNDEQLIDLVTVNGTHFLIAEQTDLQVGRTVGAYGAWLMMLYEFYYPRFPR
jgi:hypothetical protein